MQPMPWPPSEGILPQVLWLDAFEQKYVEEVGTSNIFFLD